MSTFTMQIVASASFSADAPTLEVLVGGIVVGSTQITSGANGDYFFTLDFENDYPSSLQFRFNDASGEGGRSISIASVRINGTSVDTGYITLLTLLQTQTSTLNAAAVDHLFGRTTPTEGDFSGTPNNGTGGDDSIVGSNTDPDIISAGNGHDRIRGRDAENAIFGGAGDDKIFAGAGNDVVMGGAGLDWLYGEDGDDILYGDDGDDIVVGGLGNDVANGGIGNDTLSGEAGADILFGDDGDDMLIGGAGDDHLFGDDGADTLSGGADNDTLYGGLGNDKIYGDAGNDTLYGEAGDDLLNGGGGNDVLYGNNDNDTLIGGAGNDTLDGGAGYDVMNGGVGTDTLTYANAAAGITVSLALTTAQNTGGAGTDTISNFENLIGSDYADVLTGNTLANVISGGLGNDVIDGGLGDDTLDGGADTNTVVYQSATSGVTVNLTAGTATGGAGTDTLSNFLHLIGSDYADTLTGTTGNNIISGGLGGDTIHGGDGADTLYAVTAPITVFTTNFNSGTESFSYADNVFGGTGDAYVSGSRNTGDGVNGNGSLEVFFDGTNATASGTMSGGHSRSFTLTEDVQDTVLTFQYKVIRSGTYETDEDSFVYVEIDGVRYGLNGNDHIVRMESDGNDPTYDTGWRQVSIDLGTLYQGNHTITLGGLVEGKNAADEDTTIRFDNVAIGTDPGSDNGVSNILNGGSGNDTLYGSAGTDTLNGGDGADSLYSGSTANVTSASILAAYPGMVYNATTDSFYLHVTSALTWEAANSAATAYLVNGVAGHLAHSNSATENAYLDSITGTANFWLGGSDGTVNGEWRWVGGPDDGTQFWQGLANGSAIGGAYTNWGSGEPNDYNGFEAHLEFYNGGTWNDQLPSTTRGYVIEWEADQILTSGNPTVLAGGDGLDQLYGSDGADIFQFDWIGAANDDDVIHNFDYTDGDGLDLSDLLSAFDPVTEAIADFVALSDGTSDDLYQLITLNYDPLLYYRMGETSGSTMVDAMGILNGTYDNNPGKNNTAFNASIGDGSIDFNGSNERGRVDDNAVFDLTAGTFVAWAKSETGSGTHSILSKHGSGTTNGQFHFGANLSNGNVTGELQIGGNTYTINVDPIAMGAADDVDQNDWNFYAFTFGAGGATLYFNGVAVYSNANFTSITGSDYRFIVGAENSGGNTTYAEYWNGDIDEVAVYDYKMGSQSINHIYQAGLNAFDGAVPAGVYVSPTGAYTDYTQIATLAGTVNVTNAMDLFDSGQLVV
ncbi:LamG-like jellyroll fold domain-containing protein [Micavibrio aeruginosavorus]|uniref:Alkaline phosphatase n=1 Tax=Micavibrio aeruginosavorus EPB TaxID=349215 RepID=M4VIZ2_9BACT|nr:LamG-like jellyroll fold domain-containing protein [Micavibrio aeruginosavorus]AGH99183.1 Alkaline phosphatase [Micavibrio aeruginosavorus EPB]